LQYLKKYILGIKKVVSKIKPNIISVCDDGLKGFFIPKIISNKIPIIYERHVSKVIEFGVNPTFIKKSRVSLKFFIMNILAKSFHKFIVLTDDNNLEWDLQNSIIIPNPLSFFPSQTAPLNTKKVIAIGKQGVQKGYDRLLHSWKIVQENHPDWELSIYGKFEAESNLVKLSKEPNYLKIEIEDKGEGISETGLKFIYNKFYHSKKNPLVMEEGLGIGLYYCKKIIEAHLGTIDIESQKGVGTTVTVKLKI
jgi:glycosyltransferase involved in cell wall biosynthesis